jgi:hypothetical protein
MLYPISRINMSDNFAKTTFSGEFKILSFTENRTDVGEFFMKFNATFRERRVFIQPFG